MLRRRNRVPKYRHYRPKDLAVVRINGRDHYLGKFNSPESWEWYDRLIAEWLGNGRNLPPASSRQCLSTEPTVSINELMLAYWHFALGYYRKNGEPTGEIDNIRAALHPLRQLYGATPSAQFGPRALEVVRQSMIESGLARTVINARLSRIKRLLRWASKKELVPAEAYNRLRSVEGLQRGRTSARETQKVQPVADDVVEATLPQLQRVVRAMV